MGGNIDGMTLYVTADGIGVNAISPGTTVTPGLNGFAPPGADLKGFCDYRGAPVPLGRNAHPDEVANVLAFLASDRRATSTVPISRWTAASHRSETDHRILLSGGLQ
jgi:NAD(P)-dependent dehydrogenase (short-subunit alcohol dehydrogenase family)